MKKNRFIAIAAIIAVVFTVPMIMTDTNAVQVGSADGPNFNGIPSPSFPSHGQNPIGFQPQRNPHMPMMAARRPSYVQPGNRPGVQINWERLEVNGINGLNMYRTPVPGGWLMTTQSGNQKAGAQLVFIPDVIHSWGSSQPVYPPSPYGAYPAPRTSRVPQVYPTYPPNPYGPQPNFVPVQPSPNLFVPAQPNPSNPNGAPYSPQQYNPQQHNPPNFNPQNSFPPGNQSPGNQSPGNLSPSNTPQFNQPSASNVPSDSMPSTPNVRPQNDSKNQIRPIYSPKTGWVQPSENRNRQPRINRPTPATSDRTYSDADSNFDEMPTPTLNPRRPRGHQSGHQNSLNPKAQSNAVERYIDDQPRASSSYAPSRVVNPDSNQIKPTQVKPVQAKPVQAKPVRVNPTENPLSNNQGPIQRGTESNEAVAVQTGAFVIQGDRVFLDGRQVYLTKQAKSEADDSLDEDVSKPVPSPRSKPKTRKFDTKPAPSRSVDRAGSSIDQPNLPEKNESKD